MTVSFDLEAARPLICNAQLPRKYEWPDANGVLFYDISPLLARPAAWNETLDRPAGTVRKYKPDVLAGIESRGFLVAAPLAARLNLGFVMVHKKNKLPGTTILYIYNLEYGRDTIEAQANAIQPGQKVFVLDDLLATGGTMRAPPCSCCGMSVPRWKAARALSSLPSSKAERS